jgi:hypothetical protein
VGRTKETGRSRDRQLNGLVLSHALIVVWTAVTQNCDKVTQDFSYVQIMSYNEPTGTKFKFHSQLSGYINQYLTQSEQILYFRRWIVWTDRNMVTWPHFLRHTFSSDIFATYLPDYTVSLPEIFNLNDHRCEIGIVGGGVQLGPLGTAAINRPIVPAPGDYDGGEIGGIIGRGNRSTRRKPALVPLCPP